MRSGRSRVGLAALGLALACLASPASAVAGHAGPLAGQWHLDTDFPGDADNNEATPDSSGHGLDVATRNGVLIDIAAGGRFGDHLSATHAGVLRRPTASPLLQSAGVTVLGWVRRSGPPPVQRYVAGQGDDGGTCNGSSYALYTGVAGRPGLTFYIRPAASPFYKPSPAAHDSIWDGRWHMVAGTFDGSTVRLWVDGAQVGTGTPAPGDTINYAFSGNAFYIDGYPVPACGEGDFPGGIDELRVYGRALSGTEIARLAAAPGPNPPALVPDAPGQPPPPPPISTSPPPPVSPAPVEHNVKVPQIIPVSRTSERARYECTSGTWEGLAPGQTFGYSWWRLGPRPSLSRDDGLVPDPPSVRVATGPTYSPSSADAGRVFHCQVDARGRSGRLLTAESPRTVLTGRESIRVVELPVWARKRAYGNVRVRGIDLFQTVQPNSGAQMFSYEPSNQAASTPFPTFCGGGTPTSINTCVPGNPVLPAADTARTTYAGVPLDQRKPTTAVVYVDMEGTPASDRKQKLDVTLSARLGGRLLPGGLVKRRANRPETSTPWVTATERADPKYGVRFEVPAAWLALAALAHERLDLQATVALPVGAGSGLLVQCTGCGGDDRFELEDVPVFDPPELRIRSVPLLTPGQSTTGPGALAAPDTVLSKAVELFPGGERLDILPYNGQVDITPLGLTATSGCGAAPMGETAAQRGRRVRACRSTRVGVELEDWRRKNREEYNILLGVHRYDSGNGADEPGWASGGFAAGAPAVMALNDGSRGRPLTAAAHEFGHALGLPHADSLPPNPGPPPTSTPDPVTGDPCGGNDFGEVGEPWAPDNTGRLQGIAFERSRPGTARIDSPATPLFDLMSYCANGDANAWLSARNWNRAFRALTDFDAASRLRAARASAARTGLSRVRAGRPGQAFALGTLGPGGGRIVRVVPADPDNLAPAPEPSSPLRLRTLDAAGKVLSEDGVRVERLTDVPGAATFVAQVPAGAAAVELRSGGTVLHRRQRSRPPTVRVLAPRRGTRARRALVVRWRASDADREELQATVDYAADGDTRWRTVLQGPSSGRATVPGRFLEASRRGRVRVTVNDGFNQARARSAAFRADGSPPTARIVRPEAGESPQAGRVLLIGSGLDDRQRRLRGRALTWFAGRKRLGSGEQLRARLPAGRVKLRLRARDRFGRVRTAVRRLRIEPVALQLRMLRGPYRVGHRARRLALTLATTTSATLRAGGRSYRVGPRPRRVLVRLPSRPRIGVLRVSLKIAGRAAKQRVLRETILVLRV